MTSSELVLPMFPLESALFPSMPVVLRVFEQRYLALLSEVVGQDPPEFGIVLIERGREVGGGDARFSVGTVARITELDAGDDFIALIGVGTRRIEVVEWLDEDPFPRALVRDAPVLEWSETLRGRLEEAERSVRAALAVASEFADTRFPATIALAEDPVAAAWQLAAISPIGELDRVRLLGSADVGELLDGIVRETAQALEDLRFRAADDDTDDDEEGEPS